MASPEPSQPPQPDSAPGPLPAPPASAPPAAPPPPIPAQPGYGPAPQGYAPPPPGYGQPPGTPPGYGPPLEYGPPAGYGSPAGYGPPAGYGSPAGYGPPAHLYPGPPAGSPPPPVRRTGLIIAIVAGAVALLLLLVCAVGAFFWYRYDSGGGGQSTFINYRETNPDALRPDHVPDGTPLSYPMRPPAGGPHYNRWQNCNGDVYPEPIEDGNAVHSLEHGAVWITYQEGLSPGEVERLADRVRGQTYLMMSPYRFLNSKVTLQAWGYQLVVDDVDDERIDEFIRQYRETAAIEPGATCGGGVTTTR